ncbi:uncharacterized protein F5147DRAFT_741494 [Suillus discolor]|uniref:Uncharacterized protein n=1 Tax=Suillus discolor TaxID=1912936 RepID=A0A9P7FLE0_9AGAM|nr:uncharacterized protein F5147DRAFT_741494 [Suillus discolor]KAG2120459.1 hypothetical protein F5147DRAFT_741494 [Suillus discolor]
MDDDHGSTHSDNHDTFEPYSLTEFTGDYFGTYNEEDFKWPEVHQVMESDSGTQEEHEDEDCDELRDGDAIAAHNAELEHGWEHPVDPASQNIDFPDSEDVSLQQQPCHAEQRQAEAPLGQHPTIEEFPRCENIWASFTSHVDYEVAKWAKLCGAGSTAFSELLAIDGLRDALGLSYQNSHELNQIIDQELPCRRPYFKHKEIIVVNEVFDVYSHNIMECVKALYSDPDFSQHLLHAPERHYVDSDKTVRMYHDLHTGKWWWSTQKELETKKHRATVIPIILSSDKTQVTMFRNKSAYPVYMTIGNIPKEIRRKPSQRAWILLAYLPTAKLKHITNKAVRCWTSTNLFHTCLHHILEPLRVPREDGVAMASGDGVIHRGHPILACYSADYPEQLLTTGIESGEYELGRPDIPVKLRDFVAILAALSLVDEDYGMWTRACQECGIKLVFKPFWEDLPHANIFQSITPDGIIKHLIEWIKEEYSKAKIDACCRRLPPNHSICLFMKGISSLSHVSGTEHNQICRFLLGVIIDIRLPGNLDSARLIHAVFNFNLPKLHFFCHYVHMIKLYGTTDNYNTEYTECLHIDLAKDAYRATNHKDKYPQMTLWLERHEKMLWHNNFVQWRLAMTKHLTAKHVSLDRIICGYGAIFFMEALACYVIRTNQPTLSAVQLKQEAAHIVLPFQTVATFHRVKFYTINTSGYHDPTATIDSVHCQPPRKDNKGHIIPGHFDTVLVNEGDGGTMGANGYHVAQVRVVFTLTSHAAAALFRTPAKAPTHFAYMEWFTPFGQPEANHGLYKISHIIRNGERLVSIIDISDICRSVHLIPKFGPVVPHEWTSSTVLELCSSFFVNSFSDRHAYLTII